MMNRLLAIFASLIICATTVFAQDENVVVLPPLFDVPEVPQNIDGLQERSEWLLDHFWDPMDFNATSVGQAQLNHAFGIYVVPMQWASGDEVLAAVTKLVGKLKKNPTLMYQFTKAAEENLYGPNANIWIDDVYMQFLEALLKNKKVSDVRKAKYKMQADRIRSSLIGNSLPRFKYTDNTGAARTFSHSGRPAAVIFGYPDCDDCRLLTLRLASDIDTERKLKQGEADVYFIIPSAEEETTPDVLADYPKEWHTGYATDLDDTLDLRLRPSVYLLDAQGHITAKNVDPKSALPYIKSALGVN